MQDIQQKFLSLLSVQLAGNTVLDILSAIAFFLVLYFAVRIVRTILLSGVKKWTEKSPSLLNEKLLEIFQKLSPWFYSIVSLYITLSFFVVLNANAKKITNAIFVIFLVFQILKISQTLIEYIFGAFLQKKEEKQEEADHTVLNALRIVTTVGIWVIGILLILSNLGINVTTLVASLGIGGIAIALAAQNILSDIFASFSLYFDRPFRIGDQITVGKDSGVVKDIGLKTTRLQTPQGEELVIPNRELTESRVQNFKQMEKRRIVFSFGVTYNTPLEKLKKIPGFVQESIEQQKIASFDRAHFFRFGDSSLDFEVVYFVNTDDYTLYMDTQQAINFQILQRFEKEHIEMAFPTRTVYMKADKV